MSETYKPKVVFTFVEAGLGHIMPMNGLYDSFVKKYGDKCRVEKSYIFSESKHPAVVKMGKAQAGHVKKLSGSKFYSWFECVTYELPSRFILWTLDRAFAKARKGAMQDLKELNPDMLVSSYYLPSHLAVESNKKGLTNTLIASYMPDNYVYPAWDRRCDLLLVNCKYAFNMAINKGYDKDIVREIPFIYKKEVENFDKTKEQCKEELSLNNGKFTLLCAMGAYGVKKARKIVKKILEEDLDINFVVICGKNQEMLDYMNSLKEKNQGKTNFIPVGFTDKIGTYFKASELVIGKGSMNTVMEVCYIGTPFVSFSEMCGTEVKAAKYFKDLDIITREHKAKGIINLIKKGMEDEHYFDAKIKNFESFRKKGASDLGADLLFEALKKRYPEL